MFDFLLFIAKGLKTFGSTFNLIYGSIVIRIFWDVDCCVFGGYDFAF